MPQLIEPLEFIKKIHNAGVKYLLIGRQAVIAYGGPVQSMDYDIYVDGSKENIDILLSIAMEFDLIPTVQPEHMHKHFMFKLENDFVVDVFRAKAFSANGKKITFEDMYKRNTTMKGTGGLEINLPSLDDLIALKKLRSLPKDLQDIEYLRALKDK